MKQKILLLVDDDDPDDNFLFTDCMRELAPDVQLFTCADGQEALDWLLLPVTPTPHLIFMDLNMPRLNGRQCLETLKKHPSLQHVPVFMYTTSHHSRDIDECFTAGADCFISKPGHIDALRELLASACAFMAEPGASAAKYIKTGIHAPYSNAYR